jgi:hypothetical protein
MASLPVQPVRAALLDPPPFDPSKLSIEYLPGGRGPLISSGRRYTLTHNDVTGSLQLSIGAHQEFGVAVADPPLQEVPQSDGPPAPPPPPSPHRP